MINQSYSLCAIRHDIEDIKDKETCKFFIQWILILVTSNIPNEKVFHVKSTEWQVFIKKNNLKNILYSVNIGYVPAKP